MKQFVDLPHLPWQCDTILYGKKYADKLGEPPFRVHIFMRSAHSLGVFECPCGEASDVAHPFPSTQAVGGVQQFLKCAEVCANGL